MARPEKRPISINEFREHARQLRFYADALDRLAETAAANGVSQLKVNHEIGRKKALDVTVSWLASGVRGLREWCRMDFPELGPDDGEEGIEEASEKPIETNQKPITGNNRKPPKTTEKNGKKRQKRRPEISRQ